MSVVMVIGLVLVAMPLAIVGEVFSEAWSSRTIKLIGEAAQGRPDAVGRRGRSGPHAASGRMACMVLMLLPQAPCRASEPPSAPGSGSGARCEPSAPSCGLRGTQAVKKDLLNKGLGVRDVIQAFDEFDDKCSGVMTYPVRAPPRRRPAPRPTPSRGGQHRRRLLD